ncbi:hypothetical protein P43SY_010405 [Pythium insidiosum]|uniref:Chromo domain-containing protein n=1 Tax=Pythium insidiosum TaxID=114742 RepID=A0AAD5L737_PYTIN|nr:hypothetical protein P43SY_010405 [Pythium insidiosum]
MGGHDLPLGCGKTDDWSGSEKHPPHTQTPGIVTGDWQKHRIEQDVHSSRLKLYANKDFQVTQEVVEHVAAQGIMLAVAKLLEHRWNPSKRHHELLVSWKGLEPIEDSWESLKSLAKDIPVLVKAYAETHGDKSLRQALSKLLA